MEILSYFLVGAICAVSYAIGYRLGKNGQSDELVMRAVKNWEEKDALCSRRFLEYERIIREDKQVIEALKKCLGVDTISKQAVEEFKK